MPAFAQLPAASGDQILTVLVGAGALLYLARLARDLFWPVKPSGSEYVTKAELRELLEPLKVGLERLDKYTHDNIHEIRSGINVVTLKLELIGRDVLALTRLADKVEANNIELARLTARMPGDHRPAERLAPTREETAP